MGHIPPAAREERSPHLRLHQLHLQPTVNMTTALKSIKSLAPLLDRVLVQRVKAEAKTAGGLFLPETAVKELNEAKVLAVGPGLVTKEGSRIPMSVHQGDKVLIPQVRRRCCIHIYLLRKWSLTSGSLEAARSRSAR